MSHVVIVGGGVGGLYAANCLINEGVSPTNIVIIEPRTAYTRPQYIDRSTFNVVSHFTKMPIKPSKAQHIKDIERPLSARLRALNVSFVQETFIKLTAQTAAQTKGVITLRSDGSQGFYPADHVFDCSGKKAVGAGAVNAYLKSIGCEPFFKTSLLSEINPIPDHLTAQVIIPNAHFLKSFSVLSSAKLPYFSSPTPPKKQIEMRERLVSLGWVCEAFPTFYVHKQDDETDKVVVSMETPPGLAKNQQRDWIELLLNIYSDGQVTTYTELEKSKKHHPKPRILQFKTTTHALNHVIFYMAETFPYVLITFDALKRNDYRHGNGIKSGMECFGIILAHMTIADGRIQSINLLAIEKATLEYLNGYHKNQLTQLYAYRQQAIIDTCFYHSALYEQLASSSENPKKYEALSGELAYQGAMTQLAAIKSREHIPLDRSNACLSGLLTAQRKLPASERTKHEAICISLGATLSYLLRELKPLDTQSEFYSKELLRDVLKNVQTLPFVSATSQGIINKLNSLLEPRTLQTYSGGGFFSTSRDTFLQKPKQTNHMAPSLQLLTSNALMQGNEAITLQLLDRVINLFYLTKSPKLCALVFLQLIYLNHFEDNSPCLRKQLGIRQAYTLSILTFFSRNQEKTQLDRAMVLEDEFPSTPTLD